jgi:putative ABC transport system ATP-binding protein
VIGQGVPVPAASTSVAATATPSPCRVEARGVQVSFSTGRRRVDVLRGLDLVIGPGERVALIGPSGVGKSTFLYCVAGLVRPQAGAIVLDGVDLGALDDATLADLRLRRIGIVYQAFHLLAALSALDNVALPLRLAGWGRTAARERARELLERVGLGDRADHRPAQLSGGEQQRVAVARAVANDPGLILADEPTGSLDPEVGDAVLDLLLEEARGRTVVVVTHQPAVAARLGRIVGIRGGRVVEDG